MIRHFLTAPLSRAEQYVLVGSIVVFMAFLIERFGFAGIAFACSYGMLVLMRVTGAVGLFLPPMIGMLLAGLNILYAPDILNTLYGPEIANAPLR